MLSFFYHTLYKNWPQNTKRSTGLDSHQSTIAGRLTWQRVYCLHVRLYMKWKLLLETLLLPPLSLLDVCKHQFIKRGRRESGESGIVYTLASGAKKCKYLTKGDLFCNPLLGTSQWVNRQFAPDIVGRFINLDTVLRVLLHFLLLLRYHYI